MDYNLSGVVDGSAGGLVSQVTSREVTVGCSQGCSVTVSEVWSGMTPVLRQTAVHNVHQRPCGNIGSARPARTSSRSPTRLSRPIGLYSRLTALTLIPSVSGAHGGRRAPSTELPCWLPCELVSSPGAPELPAAPVRPVPPCPGGPLPGVGGGTTYPPDQQKAALAPLISIRLPENLLSTFVQVLSYYITALHVYWFAYQHLPKHGYMMVFF